jgi:hypothetical protein
VRDPFLAFLEQHGLELCGYPLTNQVTEDGQAVQFFQCLVLEEVEPGVVRPRSVGVELLAYRTGTHRAGTQLPPPLEPGRQLNPPPFPLANLVGELPRHMSQAYPLRPIEDIHHLVIHHTGTEPDVDPETLALFHVHRLGWPGIGYHFVIGADGRVAQTHGLMTASFHARQFNASAVGIALAGDYEDAVPPTAQLDACARLCAWLLEGLGLPVEAIEGHRELVTTTCPGNQWLRGAAWKELLLARVRRLMGQEPAPAGEKEVEGVAPSDAASSPTPDVEVIGA